jgi:hypothetical protein
MTTPQKQPETYLIRATRQNADNNACSNRKHSLCLLAIVVLRFMRALNLTFDGQAMSLDLSVGNFDLLGVGSIFDA